MGGIFLHQGNIAEMKTGEGKTLVGLLPAYLNGLSGKGVHVVTVNDYLARRDAEWMGLVYHALGLTVGDVAAATGLSVQVEIALLAQLLQGGIVPQHHVRGDLRRGRIRLAG